MRQRMVKDQRLADFRHNGEIGEDMRRQDIGKPSATPATAIIQIDHQREQRFTVVTWIDLVMVPVKKLSRCIAVNPETGAKPDRVAALETNREQRLNCGPQPVSQCGILKNDPVIVADVRRVGWVCIAVQCRGFKTVGMGRCDQIRTMLCGQEFGHLEDEVNYGFWDGHGSSLWWITWMALRQSPSMRASPKKARVADRERDVAKVFHASRLGVVGRIVNAARRLG
jgi:hypothetical protein